MELKKNDGWREGRVGVGMDWIDLACDRKNLQALVNAVTNLRVSYNAGNFLTI